MLSQAYEVIGARLAPRRDASREEAPWFQFRILYTFYNYFTIHTRVINTSFQCHVTIRSTGHRA